MTTSLRIKIAAAATAVAVGGLAAVGLAVRKDGTAVDQAAAVHPEVVHRKKVRSVPVGRTQPEPAPATAQSSASAPEVVAQPAAQPAVVSEPQPVTSQVSPSGGGYDDEAAEEEDGEGGEGFDD